MSQLNSCRRTMANVNTETTDAAETYVTGRFEGRGKIEKTKYSISVGNDEEKETVAVSCGLPPMALFIPGFVPKAMVQKLVSASNVSKSNEAQVYPSKPKDCDDKTAKAYDEMKEEFERMTTLFEKQVVTNDEEKETLWNNFVIKWEWLDSKDINSGS